jgi:uncharacterized protein YuzE
MKLTYDPKHNIAYIRLHEKKKAVDTIRLSDAVNIDIAPDGTVFGIELLNANEQLQGEDGGRIIIVNKAAGKKQELALA